MGLQIPPLITGIPRSLPVQTEVPALEKVVTLQEQNQSELLLKEAPLPTDRRSREVEAAVHHQVLKREAGAITKNESGFVTNQNYLSRLL